MKFVKIDTDAWMWSKTTTSFNPKVAYVYAVYRGAVGGNPKTWKMGITSHRCFFEP